MNRSLLFTGVALAFLMLATDQGYSRGGGRGPRNNQDENNNHASATPTPAPVVPVQGTIIGVTPFAVSIKATPESMALTFKVSRDSAITLDGMPVTIAELKPGMVAVVTPASDKVYADTIVAKTQVAAAPSAPVAAGSNTAPAPQVPQPSSPSSASSGGGSFHPFGQQGMP